MARQTGDIKICGTIDGICFYKIGTVYYARAKPELSAKKFWGANCFKGSRNSAILLGRASRIASSAYRRAGGKLKGDYQKLVGIAYRMLKSGENDEIVRVRLSTEAGVIRFISKSRPDFVGSTSGSRQERGRELPLAGSLYVHRHGITIGKCSYLNSTRKVSIKESKCEEVLLE